MAPASARSTYSRSWPTAAVRPGLIVEQVAYVDTNPEHDSTLLDFIETVAVNRGVRVRVFGTVSEAETWLATLPPLRQDELTCTDTPPA